MDDRIAQFIAGLRAACEDIGGDLDLRIAWLRAAQEADRKSVV